MRGVSAVEKICKMEQDFFAAEDLLRARPLSSAEANTLRTGEANMTKT